MKFQSKQVVSFTQVNKNKIQKSIIFRFKKKTTSKYFSSNASIQ
jgi:hypothetical protein